MEKVDITGMELTELKALYFDKQQELSQVKQELGQILMQIQKKESVGEKVKQVLKQLPKGNK